MQGETSLLSFASVVSLASLVAGIASTLNFASFLLKVPENFHNELPSDAVVYRRLAFNAGLLVAFMIHHSWFSHQRVKRYFETAGLFYLHRAAYVLCTAVALESIIYLWRPIDYAVWDARDSPLLRVAAAAGIALLFVQFLLYDALELFGIKQVRSHTQQRTPYR
jgi:hypothetical protein